MQFHKLQLLDFVVSILGVVGWCEYTWVLGMNLVYYHTVDASTE